MVSLALLSVLSLSVCFSNAKTLSQDRKPTIDFKAGNGSLQLASNASPVHLMLDAADWPGVLRAAHDVAVDFGRVTGTNGTLTTVGRAGNVTTGGSASVIFNVTGISNDWSVGNSGTKGKGTVIAGTIGNSSLIDGLIKSGKLDVSKIEGEWEAYVSTVIKNPTNGTDEALVIAGELYLFPNQNKKKTISNKLKEAISAVPYMVSTISLNRSACHHGTGSQMFRPNPTPPSTLCVPRKRRKLLL